MPTTFLTPLLLRLAGPIAFVIAAMAAGAMNRSVMIIPLLALAATATTILIRLVSPFPALDLKSALSPDASPPKNVAFRGAGRRLLIGTVGYGFAFAFAAVVAAVFQATEFQPRLSLDDSGFAVIPGIIAFVGALVGARIGVYQMAGVMDQMQDMFAQAQNPSGTAPTEGKDVFTFEGEIIDPDKPDS